MIRRLVLALCLAAPAQAQAQIISPIVAGPSHTGTFPYSGPGDIVSSASAWYSVARAYNNTVALAGANAVTLRAFTGTNAGNSTTIKVLSNGLVDVPAANAWAGIDTASISCTSAANTLTCTSASSKPNPGDTFTGPGVTQPCYALSVGTFTGGAGTVTTQGAGCGTIASPVTMVAQGALYASTVYDQTAGNACGSAACDLVQATTNDQPVWLPYCSNGGTEPCISMNSAVATMASANNFTPNGAFQVTLEAVGNEVSGTGTTNLIQQNANNNLLQHSATNTWKTLMGGSAGATGTANDAAWNVGVGVGQAGANATILNINGTETTATRTPNATAGAPQIKGVGSTTLLWSEAGFWDHLVMTQTQRTNVCHNAATFYGVSTGTFC